MDFGFYLFKGQSDYPILLKRLKLWKTENGKVVGYKLILLLLYLLLLLLLLLVLLLSPCRLGDVRWKLCMTDSSGKQHWSDADSFNLFASSVCIRWYTLQLPPLSKLKMLQLFAFLPIFYHRNWTPHANRYCKISQFFRLVRCSEGFAICSGSKSVRKPSELILHRSLSDI